ncbi:MAG: ATP-binding protein, partial [Planctomycetota bacterium]
EAASAGMKRSLMQRLVERDDEQIYRRLTVQYRMHQMIMRHSSDQFYDGSLVADASVRDHRLSDLPDVAEEPAGDLPVMFIDTAGAGYEEQLEPDGESKLNPQEGQLVLRLVRELTDAGVRADQIAIIAPYAAQVRWLRNRLELPGLQVDTVDGFQGREKEAVILTMVRSNDRGEIGFLSDTRRTNVALTRAKRKLIVIGDSATLGSNSFYGTLLDYFESVNAYHSVWEFAE